ncbi:MAG: UDP-3-O-(3-hydroxymyristoyl)glucosamine N-acyltransferase [Thermodesulfovibrionales bacterium]|nr:UDP-3-O-(3-hydroxymyristoyl)glucosamine N-acyltransferase [Thermodesulfovibrionales bacterium]
MKLSEIARIVDGRIIGDPDLEIIGAAGILEAEENYITFVSERKWLNFLSTCKASAVIVKEEIEGLLKAQIIVKNPLYAFSKLLKIFYPSVVSQKGLSKDAYISKKALLGDNVIILPFVYISDGVQIGSNTIIYPNVYIGEDVIIGLNCIIYPNVVIQQRVKIGNNVIIHPGAVIGSDGFGYVQEEGVYHKIPQVGTVIIEDDVEIGSNTTIDRATTGATIVGKGTKIDNLVQIGHNVKVGKNVIIVSQTGIGGSSKIGDDVILGGQVGIADHVVIEDGTTIAAKAGVMGKVGRGVYSGAPILPHKEWLRAIAIFNRLPELKKRIEELEEKIKQIESSS